MDNFESLSELCKTLFILLQSMREISFLYEFDSKAIMKILGETTEPKLVERPSVEGEVLMAKPVICDRPQEKLEELIVSTTRTKRKAITTRILRATTFRSEY